ncbi:MAG: DUF4097 domain-containing protein [Bryobacteraceae bacterium]|nr:DUF4097 domain-containing protein [Bryobacteraceae bacterium]
MRVLTTLAAAAALSALAGCDWMDPSEWGQMQRYKEPWSAKEKLASGGRVTLETFNGKIELFGWDREEASIEVLKYAAREETLSQMDVDVTADAGSLRVRVRQPGPGCNCGASLTVRLPRRVILEDARTSNGSVSLESLEGSGRATTSNGSLRAWDVRGDWTLRTSNGAVELDRVEGSFLARTSNGRIRVSALKGKADVETSNGSIDAEIREPEQGAPLAFRSSNGSVTVKFERWGQNPLRVVTSNASITLVLPDGVNADVRAVTSNGRITSDFEVASREWGRHRLEGRLGGGGERLDLTTSNGNIRLVRR